MRILLNLALLSLLFGLSVPSFAVDDPYTSLDARVNTLLNNGQYTEAIPLLEKLIPLAEKKFGGNHENTEKALNHLAEACRREIDTARNQGREDPPLAQTLTKLARIYQIQGNLTEAEPLYKQALSILEVTEGLDSALFAQTLNNLALLYHAVGRSAEAETLFRQALAVYEQIYGPNHKDAALTLINIGSADLNQGKFAEAEADFKRALEILEKKLGPNDPYLIPALNNYSGLYFAQEKFAEAEPLVQRALKIAEKNYGLTNHPDVLTSLDNLEWIYAKMGRTEELTKIQEKTKRARFSTGSAGSSVNLGGLPP